MSPPFRGDIDVRMSCPGYFSGSGSRYERVAIVGGEMTVRIMVGDALEVPAA